ncbi:hypothetical protein N879_14510 [Alcaligenes sp. EGD-AK7]|nr:hypothetical protein N879_14510 [Alcaligenes sp. EGD-AK7]
MTTLLRCISLALKEIQPDETMRSKMEWQVRCTGPQPASKLQ